MGDVESLGQLAGRGIFGIKPLQQYTLEPFYRLVQRAFAQGVQPLQAVLFGQGQLGQAQFVPFQQADGPIQAVAQLAHVARPGVMLQVIAQAGGQAGAGAFQLGGKANAEVLGQRQYVFLPFAQRRYAQVEHVEPVEQILPELAALHQSGQVLLGGANDPNIDLYFLLVAEAAEHAVLQHAQQLHLHQRRHFANFIQCQGAAVGLIQHAAFALGVVAKGAGGVAEQFVFGGIVGDGGAVEQNKGAFTAQAGLMAGAGQQILAGAGFALYQQRGVQGGEPAGFANQLFHRRALGDKAVEVAAVAAAHHLEVLADTIGGLEHHHGAGQALLAGFFGHPDGQKVGQIGFAVEGDFFTQRLGRGLLQPARHMHTLQQRAHGLLHQLLRALVQQGAGGVVGQGDSALGVERHHRIGQRLEQRHNGVMLLLRGHAGDGFYIKYPGNTTNGRHQVLQGGKVEGGEVEINDAADIDFDTA